NVVQATLGLLFFADARLGVRHWRDGRPVGRTAQPASRTDYRLAWTCSGYHCVRSSRQKYCLSGLGCASARAGYYCRIALRHFYAGRKAAERRYTSVLRQALLFVVLVALACAGPGRRALGGGFYTLSHGSCRPVSGFGRSLV